MILDVLVKIFDFIPLKKSRCVFLTLKSNEIIQVIRNSYIGQDLSYVLPTLNPLLYYRDVISLAQNIYLHREYVNKADYSKMVLDIFYNEIHRNKLRYYYWLCRLRFERRKNRKMSAQISKVIKTFEQVFSSILKPYHLLIKNLILYGLCVLRGYDLDGNITELAKKIVRHEHGRSYINYAALLATGGPKKCLKCELGIKLKKDLNPISPISVIRLIVSYGDVSQHFCYGLEFSYCCSFLCCTRIVEPPRKYCYEHFKNCLFSHYVCGARIGIDENWCSKCLSRIKNSIPTYPMKSKIGPIDPVKSSKPQTTRTSIVLKKDERIGKNHRRKNHQGINYRRKNLRSINYQNYQRKNYRRKL